MDSVRFPEMTDVYLEDTDTHLLCVINWNDEQESSIELCIQKLLPQFAKKGMHYLICDYYNGIYHTNVNANETLQMKPIAPHGANVYKITKANNKPQIVRSTGHYSMGGEFSKLEYADNKLLDRVENHLDTTIDYQILLPNGKLIPFRITKGINEGVISCD